MLGSGERGITEISKNYPSWGISKRKKEKKPILPNVQFSQRKRISTHGITMSHRDNTLPQAKLCCRLWNHVLKDADNLRKKRKKRNPRHVTTHCLYTLRLVLANTQRCLKHGTWPGSYNQVGQSRTMHNLVQCLRTQQWTEKKTERPASGARGQSRFWPISILQCGLPAPWGWGRHLVSGWGSREHRALQLREGVV